MERLVPDLDRLLGKINSFGKENLAEIAHALAEGALLITGRDRVRIYLEDLTRGALSCVHSRGPHAAQISEVAFPIVSPDAMVSTVFISRSPAEQVLAAGETPSLDQSFASRFGIASSYLVPLVSHGKSLGVVCIDSEDSGVHLSSEARAVLRDFVGEVGEKLDLAGRYHQQMLLSRRVEKYRIREAARFMMESAVRLIDRLSLATVMIPVTGPDGREKLEVLASHSGDQQLKAMFDELGDIGLGQGQSLISAYLNDSAVIIDDRLLKPLFLGDLAARRLQKRAITEKMGLKTLYVIPRYEPGTRKVICLVSYFTREIYRFSDFEQGLLQTHAEMVEQVIREVGAEHPEIRVLAEITDLLREKTEGIQPFLTKVLSKATELIGADTGSIAIVDEKDGEKWLVVEDETGVIVGAKNREWLKKHIPPFRIGGPELPPEERSLTGYVAWSREPKIISRVEEEQRGEGFHRSMNELIKSEMAVPFISEDEVIAVICVNSLTPDYFTEEHRRILQIIDRLASRHLADIQRIERLQVEVNRLQRDVNYKDPRISSYRLGNIIGNSQKAGEIVEFINTVSVPLFNRITLWSTNVLQEATIGLPSILVQGPTGAGKEFFFNNLYSKLNDMYREKIDPKGELPVKKTNIAAYSGELTYSELFGHRKGAFTGAYHDRKGIVEEAAGGIVFLDEIGDADPKTQVQLLRFLDNGGFFRLGEGQERYSRVLVVAATNRNLQEEIGKGNFREDLYHRLSELSVRVPSLNERREDITDLGIHFLGKLYRTYRSSEEPREKPPLLSDEAKAVLAGHNYKGNIRELRSILLRALFFRKGRTITGDEIIRAIRDGAREQAPQTAVLLSDQVAEEILREIEAGSDFWQAVYGPFSRNAISREVVVRVIDRCRSIAGSGMPQIARHLGAVTGDIKNDDGERKRFFKFKNFLYKTVKI